MGALRTIKLSEEEAKSLKKGYEKGKAHGYRKHCRMILLKSEGLSSREVARMTCCCEVVVNTWLSRYESEGLRGLVTRPGRGRKPILDKERDSDKVKELVREHRQRLDIAKSELEKELNKSFSKKTLVRFLKVASAAVSSASGESQQVGKTP